MKKLNHFVKREYFIFTWVGYGKFWMSVNLKCLWSCLIGETIKDFLEVSWIQWQWYLIRAFIGFVMLNIPPTIFPGVSYFFPNSAKIVVSLYELYKISSPSPPTNKGHSLSPLMTSWYTLLYGALGQTLCCLHCLHTCSISAVRNRNIL